MYVECKYTKLFPYTSQILSTPPIRPRRPACTMPPNAIQLLTTQWLSFNTNPIITHPY